MTIVSTSGALVHRYERGAEREARGRALKRTLPGHRESVVDTRRKRLERGRKRVRVEVPETGDKKAMTLGRHAQVARSVLSTSALESASVVVQRRRLDVTIRCDGFF